MATTIKTRTTIRYAVDGAMPYPRGNYSSITADYQYTHDRRDVVIYQSKWYAVKKRNSFGGFVPSGQVPSSGSTYWELCSQMNFLVTGSIMSEHIVAGQIKAEHLAVGAITINTSLIQASIEKEALNINGGNLIIKGDGSIEIKGSGCVKCSDDKGNYTAMINGKIGGHSIVKFANGNNAEYTTVASDWSIKLPSESPTNYITPTLFMDMDFYVTANPSEFIKASTKLMAGEISFTNHETGGIKRELIIRASNSLYGNVYKDSNGFLKVN